MTKVHRFLKASLAAVFLLGSVFHSSAGILLGSEPVLFQIEWHDPTSGQGEMPRTPIPIPSASLEDYTLFFEMSHSDFTLTLFDGDGNTAYTTFVPSTVGCVLLSDTLSGMFKICLFPANSSYYFYGYINL